MTFPREQKLTDLSWPSLFDALVDEVVVLDDSGTIIACNRAWKAFCAQNGGNTDTHYLGTNYLDTCRNPNGEAGVEATLIPQRIRDVLNKGASFRCEYPCHSPTEKRWFEMTGSPLRHKDRLCALVQHRNISIRKLEHENAERAFLDSEVLAALVSTSNDAILSYDLDGRINTWNRAAEALYGYTAAEAVGQSLEILYPPDWTKSIAEYRDEILSGELNSFEAVRRAKSGELRNVWITAAPVRGADGNYAMISNIHRDVTEIRRAEEARELIAQEVIHRAKNMLTVVSAIHRQTVRTAQSLDDFNAKFGARIRGLATSTDLLVSGKWTTVPLDALVRSQIDPFLADRSETLAMNGPPVVLKPQAVQVLGMALHELSTNSAKHGVLRDGNGRVDIRWSLEPIDTEPHLVFDWNETGLADQGAPVSQGFGSTVLTGLSKSMLDAETQFHIAGGQVRWTLSVPAQHFRRTMISQALTGGGD